MEVTDTVCLEVSSSHIAKMLNLISESFGPIIKTEDSDDLLVVNFEHSTATLIFVDNTLVSVQIKADERYSYRLSELLLKWT